MSWQRHNNFQSARPPNNHSNMTMNSRVPCTKCERDFASLWHRDNHIKKAHDGSGYYCTFCNVTFSTANMFYVHTSSQHPRVKLPLKVEKNATFLVNCSPANAKPHFKRESFKPFRRPSYKPVTDNFEANDLKNEQALINVQNEMLEKKARQLKEKEALLDAKLLEIRRKTESQKQPSSERHSSRREDERARYAEERRRQRERYRWRRVDVETERSSRNDDRHSRSSRDRSRRSHSRHRDSNRSTPKKATATKTSDDMQRMPAHSTQATNSPATGFKPTRKTSVSTIIID